MKKHTYQVKQELESRLITLNTEIDRLNAERKKSLEEYNQLVPSYSYVTTRGYIRGIYALQSKIFLYPLFIVDNGKKIARPLTIKENMETMINDYNILIDENGKIRAQYERLKLFNDSWKDTCTGAAYKANSTKFKIIPVCKELIMLKSEIGRQFIKTDYNLIQGIELDLSKGKYNHPLSQKELLEHPAWLASVEDDKAVLKEFSDVVYSELKHDAMSFGIKEITTPYDRLGAVGINSLFFDSNSFVKWRLEGDSRFLLIICKKTKGEGK